VPIDDRFRAGARTLRNVVRNLVFVALHCRNRLALALAVVRGSGRTIAVLRDGTAIEGPEARILVPILDEVFVDRAYAHGDVRVRRGDVVVDIGAHVGAFAIGAVREGASRVIAYEPSPLNVAFLARNAERNAITSIEIVDAAVGALDGYATLELGRYSVGNTLEPTGAAPTGDSRVRVRTTTLAGIFAAHAIERIDYLKIDCEGSEGAFLAGAPPDLLARVDRIALEYHDAWSSLDHEELAGLLRGDGFIVESTAATKGGFGMIYAHRAPHLDTRTATDV
jgi:FkbM family methyltransferase